MLKRREHEHHILSFLMLAADAAPAKAASATMERNIMLRLGQ